MAPYSEAQAAGEKAAYQGAFDGGREAYSRGLAMSDNPYRVRPRAIKSLYRSWIEGWIHAVRNDPLLDQDEKDNLIGDK